MDTKISRLPKILFFASCAFAMFVWGIVTEGYKVFPYKAVHYIHDSVLQVYEDFNMAILRRPTNFLLPAKGEDSGVTRNEPDKAQPGLTFVAGFFDEGNELRLMRLDGTLVNRWPVRFSEFWPEAAHIRPAENIPKTDWNIDIHGAMALPDGSIVFNFEYGGTIKLDRCGKVLWTLAEMSHHSITASQDGGFWIPGRHYEEGKSNFPPSGTPYHEDLVMKVSADGKTLQKFSVPGVMRDNGLFALLIANRKSWKYFPEKEVIHLNDIEELPEEIADRFPLLDAGDIVVSMRKLNLLMAIDPATQKVKWHQTGPWIRQHDPDFQPDGTITLFNNMTDNTPTGSILGGSTIVGVNPADGVTKVKYGGKPSEHFYTLDRGNHQVLDNGNVLITASNAGRLIEVTPTGEIVWEYINRYDVNNVASITSADRYDEEYFTVGDWSCP